MFLPSCASLVSNGAIWQRCSEGGILWGRGRGKGGRQGFRTNARGRREGVGACLILINGTNFQEERKFKDIVTQFFFQTKPFFFSNAFLRCFVSLKGPFFSSSPFPFPWGSRISLTAKGESIFFPCCSSSSPPPPSIFPPGTSIQGETKKTQFHWAKFQIFETECS